MAWMDSRKRQTVAEEAEFAQVVSTVADVEGWGNIADVAFYKDKHLAVLTGSGGDMEEAQFVLLPMHAVPGASTGQVAFAFCGQHTACRKHGGHDFEHCQDCAACLGMFPSDMLRP